jgi:predicted ester cyclase
VRRLVDNVLNGGRLEVIDVLYAPELAPAARRWIARFRAAFPDVHMEVVDLIAEDDKVAGRFTCSSTHQGIWRGQPPTGRRSSTSPRSTSSGCVTAGFVHAWGLEDTLARMQQLGCPRLGRSHSRRRRPRPARPRHRRAFGRGRADGIAAPLRA